MIPFITLLIWLAFILCTLATLLFIVRLICSTFSSEVLEEMRSHPTLHKIWGCFALVGILFFLGILNPVRWPPISVERHAQRAEVIERVEAAGGWEAVRRGCTELAQQNTNGFYSHWRQTNGLPKAVAALRPQLVEYAPQNGCVSIKIFGMHATGGHSTPYFGLEFDISTNSVNYQHGTRYDNGGVIGNHHSIANPVADGIYEIY